MNKTQAKVLQQVFLLLKASAPAGTETKMVNGEGSILDSFHMSGELFSVILQKPIGANAAFVAMYCVTQTQKTFGPNSWVSGMTGFRCAGKLFNFDRVGVNDSWYPEDLSKRGKLRSPKDIVAEMLSELARAEKALEARVNREAQGTALNFGPVSRTLLPEEIEKYRKAIAAGKSFSIAPSGFGTGYRFYRSRTPGRFNRIPASAEARRVLGEPNLVYDSFDHD